MSERGSASVRRDPRRAAGRGLRPASALAVLLLLGHAGCSAPPAPHPASGAGAPSRAVGWRPGKPDTLGPVVAIVGRHRITRHEVDSLIATAPPNVRGQYYATPDAYKQVVQRMVENEALHMAGERDSVERDSAYQAELGGRAYDLVIKYYYLRQLHRMPAPSDSAIQAYYEAHSKEYDSPARARVRQILVKTQAQARAAQRELAGGKSWNDVVARYSVDQVSKTNGGLLGYVSSESDAVPGIGKAPGIVAAALKLKEGEISQPIKTDKGWHLITIEEYHAASHAPLADVRDRIAGLLQSQIQDDFSTALLDSLKRYEGVTVFDDSIKAALQPARTPEQLFGDAQAAPTASRRIGLYRQLVTKFPRERVSEQASFMVGFTYAEELGDYDSARKAFQEFMTAYPKSDLVKSAKWMLANMDKPTPPFEGEAPNDSTGARQGGTTITLPDSLMPVPPPAASDSTRGGVAPGR